MSSFASSACHIAVGGRTSFVGKPCPHDRMVVADLLVGDMVMPISLFVLCDSANLGAINQYYG